jgi:hypothetical protein
VASGRGYPPKLTDAELVTGAKADQRQTLLDIRTPTTPLTTDRTN